MSLLSRRTNHSTPRISDKPATFDDSVKWASDIKSDDRFKFRKNAFWMILAFVIALFVVVWLVLNYMNTGDKILPDNTTQSIESTNNKIINDMTSGDVSIAPDSGRSYIKTHRSPRNPKPNTFVSPLPNRLSG